MYAVTMADRELSFAICKIESHVHKVKQALGLHQLNNILQSRGGLNIVPEQWRDTGTNLIDQSSAHAARSSLSLPLL